MKIYSTRPPGFIKQFTAIFVVAVLTLVFAQGTAFATTASNTTISNTATVNYDDSAGNAQAAINASVDVTVNLVEATPTLSAPTDQSAFSGTAIDYTYTITTNANGVDTYTLGDSQIAADAGITGNTREIRDTAGGGGSVIGSVTLGATSVAAAAVATDTAITVPADGASDASVNGIEAGDTLIIGGNSYTVASITDNASGTSTINLSAGLSAGVSVGDLIAEQQTFYLRVTATSTVDGDTVENQVTASDGVSAAATDNTITTVNIAPSLTVTKYVANITTPVVGGGSTVTVDTGLGGGSTTYYTTGVTGDPGDTLEYVIEISNAASAGQATDVVISDPVPAFTTLVGGTVSLDPGTGTWSTVANTADNGDFGETDGTTVYIYAGSGGDDTTAGVGSGSGGSLNGGTTTLGAFQVTIDN
jgi:hypothetical protein